MRLAPCYEAAKGREHCWRFATARARKLLKFEVAALPRRGVLLRHAAVLLAAASRDYVEPPCCLAAPRCWSLFEVAPIIIALSVETRRHIGEMRDVHVLKGEFDVKHTGTVIHHRGVGYTASVSSDDSSPLLPKQT